jgi:hypothetical protein
MKGVPVGEVGFLYYIPAFDAILGRAAPHGHLTAIPAIRYYSWILDQGPAAPIRI